MKKLNNVFLVCYPLLVLFSLFLVSLLAEPFQKGEIGILPLLLPSIGYTVIFVLFTFKFVFEPTSFSKSCWRIGLIGLLICMVCLLFVDVWYGLSQLLYVNIGLSCFMLASTIGIYAMIFYVDKKRENHE